MSNPLELLGIPKFAAEMAGIPFFIGQFVMEWSKHERMLAGLIATLEGSTYEAVLAELLDGQVADFERRLRQANDNFDVHHPSRVHVMKILAKHGKLREARNDIVHGHWSGINEDQVFVLQRKKRKQEPTSRPFSVEELRLLTRELQDLFLPVVNASQAFRGEPLMGSVKQP